jgi:hypothetical protein
VLLNSFVSFTTSQYKLHYYETPTNTKFVMLTDLKSPSMRIALQQIYINLFVEYGTWIRCSWQILVANGPNQLSKTPFPRLNIPAVLA